MRMNVGKKKTLMSGLEDDVDIARQRRRPLLPRDIGQVTTALLSGHNWTEDHGEELTPEAEYGERRQVVVIS